MGGTFNVIHSGHRALLSRAFELADFVMVGITSDRYATINRVRVNPLKVRIRNLEELLKGMGRNYSVMVIDDAVGPAATLSDLDILVVSEETYHSALLINNMRQENGLPTLQVEMIPMVMAHDGHRISASRIVRGEYDRRGSYDSISVAVGSLNPVKVEAVRSILEKIYTNVRLTPISVDSGVPEQPWGMETLQGARNRAIAAILDCDISVGIEAGVFERYDGLYDIQHCAILDKHGRMTYGAGSAFRYPDKVAEMVRNGLSVGDAMMSVFRIKNQGDADGAIGILTQGLLDRKTLTEQSVIAAMVPRLRDDYVVH